MSTDSAFLCSEPEWYHAGERGADPIDPSHKGPIYTYIAPYDSNGEGDVWVKISEEAWSTKTSDWAVDRVSAVLILSSFVLLSH